MTVMELIEILFYHAYFIGRIIKYVDVHLGYTLVTNINFYSGTVLYVNFDGSLAVCVYACSTTKKLIASNKNGVHGFVTSVVIAGSFTVFACLAHKPMFLFFFFYSYFGIMSKPHAYLMFSRGQRFAE